MGVEWDGGRGVEADSNGVRWSRASKEREKEEGKSIPLS